jgi:hypothetical protein
MRQIIKATTSALLRWAGLVVLKLYHSRGVRSP